LARLRQVQLFSKAPPAFLSLADPAATTSQRTTMAIQYPANCTHRKLQMILPNSGSGMGRSLNVLAQGVQSAWNGGRVAVMDETLEWDWANEEPWCKPAGAAPRLGYDCYFERFSGCQDFVKKTPHAPNVCRDGEKRCRAKAPPFANGPALAHIMRPNARTQHWLLQEYDAFWNSASIATRDSPRASFISVHIRWGDKLVEQALIPVSRYLDKVFHIARVSGIARPVVLLSSEDGNAVDLFREAVQEHPDGSRVSVLVYQYHRLKMNCGGINVRKALGVHGTGTDKVFDRTGSYQERYRRVLAHDPGGDRRGEYTRSSANGTTCSSILGLRHLSRGHSESLALISLLNLFLALESTHIVCNSRSNWCALLHALAGTLSHKPAVHRLN